MSNEEWYRDPTTLIRELGRGDFARQGCPEIPGYDEIEEYRRGGQGAVYSAIQRSTRRRVAIKVLFEDASSADMRRRRFEREIELVSAIEHPGIVRVYDSGITSDRRLFYVMEFIKGLTLDEYVTQAERRDGTKGENGKGETFALGDRLHLFVRICEDGERNRK